MKKILLVFSTLILAVLSTNSAFAQLDERTPGIYAIVDGESVPLVYSNGTHHSASTGVLGVEVGKLKVTYKGATSGTNACDTFVLVINPEKKAVTQSLKNYDPFIKSMTPNNMLVLPLSVNKDKRIFEEGKTFAGINVSIKDRMEFEWEQITDNSFEIHVLNLIPGEYGIVFRASKLAEFEYNAIFGFTIPE